MKHAAGSGASAWAHNHIHKTPSRRRATIRYNPPHPTLFHLTMYVIRDVRFLDYDCRYIDPSHLRLVLQGVKCNAPAARRRLTIQLSKGQTVTVSEGWLAEYVDWFDDFEPLDLFRVECRLAPYSRRVQDDPDFEYIDHRITYYHAGNWQ